MSAIVAPLRVRLVVVTAPVVVFALAALHPTDAWILGMLHSSRTTLLLPSRPVVFSARLLIDAIYLLTRILAVRRLIAAPVTIEIRLVTRVLTCL